MLLLDGRVDVEDAEAAPALPDDVVYDRKIVAPVERDGGTTTPARQSSSRGRRITKFPEPGSIMVGADLDSSSDGSTVVVAVVVDSDDGKSSSLFIIIRSGNG